MNLMNAGVSLTIQELHVCGDNRILDIINMIKDKLNCDQEIDRYTPLLIKEYCQTLNIIKILN